MGKTPPPSISLPCLHGICFSSSFFLFFFHNMHFLFFCHLILTPVTSSLLPLLAPPTVQISHCLIVLEFYSAWKYWNVQYDGKSIVYCIANQLKSHLCDL